MAIEKKAEIEKFRKIWAKIIARAWSDDLFKKKLLSRPGEAVKEYGLAIPAGVNLKIFEETSTAEYLIIPKKPERELSTEELKAVAAGALLGLATIEGGAPRDFRER